MVVIFYLKIYDESNENQSVVGQAPTVGQASRLSELIWRFIDRRDACPTDLRDTFFTDREVSYF